MLDGGNNVERTLGWVQDYGTGSTGTDIQSGVIDFWKDFNLKLKQYVEDMSNEEVDYVRIDGQKFDKKLETTILYMTDQWHTEASKVVESLLKAISFNNQICQDINKLFG